MLPPLPEKNPLTWSQYVVFIVRAIPSMLTVLGIMVLSFLVIPIALFSDFGVSVLKGSNELLEKQLRKIVKLRTGKDL
jgi:hypothetical protein